MTPLVLLLAALAGSSPPTAAPSDGDTQAMVERLLGSGRRVRDFVSFTTAQAEAAVMALFVTEAGPEPSLRPEGDYTDDYCGTPVEGVALEGFYHVALVVEGALVNEVEIPGGKLRLPLWNRALYNYEVWGQGSPVRYPDPPGRRFEPTKLMRLADYNGDGHAWEFRLARYGACGHTETLLVGYGPRQRSVIVYPIVSAERRVFWHDNFFPSPNRPRAAKVKWRWLCFDHGSESEERADYVYDPRREAWVMKRERTRSCDGA